MRLLNAEPSGSPPRYGISGSLRASRPSLAVTTSCRSGIPLAKKRARPRAAGDPVATNGRHNRLRSAGESLRNPIVVGTFHRPVVAGLAAAGRWADPGRRRFWGFTMSSSNPDGASGGQYVIRMSEDLHPDFFEFAKALLAELPSPDRITHVESESANNRKWGCKVRFAGGACLHFHRKESETRAQRPAGLSTVKYDRPGPLIRAQTREAIRRAVHSPHVKVSDLSHFLGKLDELQVLPEGPIDHTNPGSTQETEGRIVADPGFRVNDRLDGPGEPARSELGAPHAQGADPFRHEPFGATIRVARGRLGGRRGGGDGGPSGWSQEIGRQLEQQVYQKLRGDLERYYGVASAPVADDPYAVKFPSTDPPPTLRWLNGDREQSQSWDLEERDSSGLIVRRHEVKSENGELTPSEHDAWKSDPDHYLVWRVYADGRIERARVVPARRPGDSPAVRSLESDAQVPMVGSTVASLSWRRLHHQAGIDGLEIGTRITATLRRLATTASRLVPLRYRGNRVWLVHPDDQTIAQLPPSKSGMFLAARSRAGLDRLFDAAADVDLSVPPRVRTPVLLVLERATGTIGLSRCIARATRSIGMS